MPQDTRFYRIPTDGGDPNPKPRDVQGVCAALAPQARGVVTAAGHTLAQCDLWWQNKPDVNGIQLGTLGHLDLDADLEADLDAIAQAAITLLRQARRYLQRQGCTIALGPMDGSTWQSYRCATDWDQGPPFWGEPQTDPRWLDWLAQAGFTPVARYESRLCRDLGQTWTPRRRRHRLASVTLGSAQGHDPEALLAQIYPLVMASFQSQPWFQPLPATVFAQAYRPLLAQVDPRLVQLAWAAEKPSEEPQSGDLGDRPVGFLLALPDALAPVGQPRLIIKTLAIAPSRAYAGLGYPLLEAAHRAGLAQGYDQAIHALMHSQNPSLNLSRRYSQPLREYLLMGASLGIDEN